MKNFGPVITTENIAETPKDGSWYTVNETENTATVIRWSDYNRNWNYMVMGNQNNVIDHGIFEEGAELIK